MMKWHLPVVAIAIVASLGCDSDRTPVASGKVVSLTIWREPVGSGSNEGRSFAEADRIRVALYDHFIIATTSDGQNYVAAHDRWSNLMYTED
jgi:hypothetical protein